VQGCLFRLAPGQPAPKRLPALLTALARHAFVAARRPGPPGGGGLPPAAKRQAGLCHAKVRLAEKALADAGLGGPSRLLLLDEEPPAAHVAAWAGGGAPLPPSDPACIVCFVSIPGAWAGLLATLVGRQGTSCRAVPGGVRRTPLLQAGPGVLAPPCCLAAFCASWKLTTLPPAHPPGSGKSALVEGLRAGWPPGAAADGTTVKVLNSDRMKAEGAGKGYQASRWCARCPLICSANSLPLQPVHTGFWPLFSHSASRVHAPQFSPPSYWNLVAAAAESYVGGGHAAVVLADKNLIPAPAGNVRRAAEALKHSGERGPCAAGGEGNGFLPREVSCLCKGPADASGPRRLLLGARCSRHPCLLALLDHSASAQAPPRHLASPTPDPALGPCTRRGDARRRAHLPRRQRPSRAAARPARPALPA
jgi:hypothetical protein